MLLEWSWTSRIAMAANKSLVGGTSWQNHDPFAASCVAPGWPMWESDWMQILGPGHLSAFMQPLWRVLSTAGAVKFALVFRMLGPDARWESQFLFIIFICVQRVFIGYVGCYWDSTCLWYYSILKHTNTYQYNMLEFYYHNTYLPYSSSA